jgi:hypothetical protein
MKISAPMDTSTSTHFSWPRLQASISAVLPCEVCSSTEAPTLISTITMFACPRCDASMSAFIPSWFLRFTSTPEDTSSRLMSTWPS